MHNRVLRNLLRVMGAIVAIQFSVPASAENIYGGPGSTSVSSYPSPIAGNAVAIATMDKYVGGASLGSRAVRWDTTSAIELGTLGTDSSGKTSTTFGGMNAAGVIVGSSERYVADTYLGIRAVRWDANGTAIELGNLGTGNDYTIAEAYAVNAANIAVGYAQKYVSGVQHGTRAVRWDASGNAIELGGIEVDPYGYADAGASAINAAGTAVGSALKMGSGPWNYSAVRWDSSGTIATELGNLGTDYSGHTLAGASGINAGGTTIGDASKYFRGEYVGSRAVRWDANSTTAIELGNLGTDANFVTNTFAASINTAGTIVGSADTFSGGAFFAPHAVRWNTGTTVAIELVNLGTDGNGLWSSYATSINTDGIIVGSARKYVGGVDLGDRAVLWGADGAPIDLNTLLSAADAQFWTLGSAFSISDTNWVAGVGSYDPDGSIGPLPVYDRAFLMQVPEPTSLTTLALGAVAFLRLRSRARAVTC